MVNLSFHKFVQIWFKNLLYWLNIFKVSIITTKMTWIWREISSVKTFYRKVGGRYGPVTSQRFHQSYFTWKSCNSCVLMLNLNTSSQQMLFFSKKDLKRRFFDFILVSYQSLWTSFLHAGWWNLLANLEGVLNGAVIQLSQQLYAWS